MSETQGLDLKLDAATQQDLNNFIQGQIANRKYNEKVQEFTNMCWDKCITSVSTNGLSRSEQSCLANCVDRFLDTSMFLVNQLEAKRNQF